MHLLRNNNTKPDYNPTFSKKQLFEEFTTYRFLKKDVF